MGRKKEGKKQLGHLLSHARQACLRISKNAFYNTSAQKNEIFKNTFQMDLN